MGAVTGMCQSGTIVDCTVRSCTVDGKSRGGKDKPAHANVGGIVGELVENGKVIGCRVEGSFIKAWSRGYIYWTNYFHLRNYYTQYSRAGCVVGYMDETGLIDCCVVKGNEIKAQSIKSCDYSKGSDIVTEDSECYAYVICGKTDGGTITNCTYSKDNKLMIEYFALYDDNITESIELSISESTEESYVSGGELSSNSGNNNIATESKSNREDSNKQNTIYIIEGSEERFDNTQIQI